MKAKRLIPLTVLVSVVLAAAFWMFATVWAGQPAADQQQQIVVQSGVPQSFDPPRVTSEPEVAIARMLWRGLYELEAGKDEAGNIVIRAQRLPGSGLGGFLVASVNKATLRDDLGNTYRFLNGETGFRKTETGEPVADRNVLVFVGPLDPSARQLYLAVPDSAEVLAPSGRAEISLP